MKPLEHQEQSASRDARRERASAALAALPRVPLAHLPTPLEELPRLSEALGGPRIFIKRDDLTGLAVGGNKTRLLEFYLGDALAQKAEVLVTGASVQSNLCRQTAAAAACHGLGCVLLLRGAAGAKIQGNLLLDHLFGAEIRPVEMADLTGIWDAVNRTAAELTAAGRRAYAITTFEPLAGAAYVDATLELDTQCDALGIAPTWIVASASGGTQAGLVLGAKVLDSSWRVLGVTSIVWQDEPMSEKIASLATQTAHFLGFDVTVMPADVLNSDRYVGQGYGISTPEGLAAMQLMARTEGILLDPVYTGKALAGLIDHIQRGLITANDTVVFLHTGGIPALFSYADEIVAGMARTPSRV
jgi:D-cysteine desulfhydrase family pyridoxal phosphate-dependent enzyme